MKHQPIHTKYHKLFGANMMMSVGTEAMDNRLFSYIVNTEEVNKTISLLANIPRYVIYEDLIEMLLDPKGAMQKSLNAMIEHDAVRLPFKQVMVEFDSPADISHVGFPTTTRKVRHFVWLVELDELNSKGEKFTATQWTLFEDGNDRFMILTPLCVGCSLISSSQLENRKDEIEIAGEEGGAGVILRAVPSIFFHKERLKDAFVEKILTGKEIDTLKPTSEAICALTVLMHTRGVAQERIAVNPKFNKSRLQSNKPAIQDHTVIRIGHVYNRAGDKIEYNPSNRTMPVHWRAGHWRQQKWGVKLSQVRPIFIQPMLINYVEGDEVPTPKIKEVTT